MNTKTITPLQRKLAAIRRILWIIFAGFSVPSVLLLLPLIYLRGSSSPRFVPGLDGGTPLNIMPFLLAAPFLLVAFLAIVLVVIYQIFKYRMEKDDELFL